MPLAPPPPYDTMFDERPAAPREVVFPQQPPDIAPFASAPALPSSEHVRLLAQYDATIAYFDAELGNLLDQLAARGKIENTLVILTADHGEEFYEHGRWGHGLAVYEESIHVPMVVWCPPLVRAGRRIDGPVRLVDLTPTILDAAGAPIQPSHDLFEGISLWNALTDEGRRLPDLPVFAELSSGGKSTRTLRADNMKVIYACSEDEERVMLFDLRADPVERLDLARSRPVECAELRTCLEAMYDSICARKMDRCEHRIDEATEETLKALGYLN
jgi:arylsulfatase A-like enzyme